MGSEEVRITLTSSSPPTFWTNWETAKQEEPPATLPRRRPARPQAQAQGLAPPALVRPSCTRRPLSGGRRARSSRARALREAAPQSRLPLNSRGGVWDAGCQRGPPGTEGRRGRGLLLCSPSGQATRAGWACALMAEQASRRVRYSGRSRDAGAQGWGTSKRRRQPGSGEPGTADVQCRHQVESWDPRERAAFGFSGLCYASAERRRREEDLGFRPDGDIKLRTEVWETCQKQKHRLKSSSCRNESWGRGPDLDPRADQGGNPKSRLSAGRGQRGRMVSGRWAGEGGRRWETASTPRPAFTLSTWAPCLFCRITLTSPHRQH